jgi:hypothetical protein
VNETNEMWRAHKQAGREHAAARSQSWERKIKSLLEREVLEARWLNAVHVRLCKPSTPARSVDLYTTTGTLVAGNQRLSGWGLAGALEHLGIEDHHDAVHPRRLRRRSNRRRR